MRGSGRFRLLLVALETALAGLNPLHCGAVVASRARARRRAARRVLIPFIAGQWSLRGDARRGGACGKRVSIPFIAGQWSLLRPRAHPADGAWTGFNPLHCGAVVASHLGRKRYRRPPPVSIPFIAGQWSLPVAAARRRPTATGFQSPSLRGSGRFLRDAVSQAHAIASQSPSLRGSGRFRKRRHASAPRRARLNPLHCGAVVASVIGPREGPSPQCLNPLHCGAVVASRVRMRRRATPRRVSIPFIAGQWSLRQLPPCIAYMRTQSQSPSLRGSGRFDRTSLSHAPTSRVSIPFIAGQWSLHAQVTFAIDDADRSLNPLHCGAVVASGDHAPVRHGRPHVSIPFIAGQWSLPALIVVALASFVLSQSPSLRGSGRFEALGGFSAAARRMS